MPGAGQRRGQRRTKQRAADQFLAYLDEVGRTTLDQAEARDLAGFWARRQRRGYAPKTTGTMRSALADFLRHLHQAGQIREDLAQRLPPQRYPRRGASAPYLWTAEEFAWSWTRSTGIRDRQTRLRDGAADRQARVEGRRSAPLGARMVDWRAKTLALTQHKTGVPLTLPLPGDVGWSVIDYIRHGRPERGLSAGVRETPLSVYSFRFVHFGGLPQRLRAAGRGRVPGRAFARPALAARRIGGRDAPNRHATAGCHGGPGSRAGKTTAAHYLRLDTEHLRCCCLDVEDVLTAAQGRGRERADAA